MLTSERKGQRMHSPTFKLITKIVLFIPLPPDLFTYMKKRETDRVCSTHWFTSQTATSAWVGPSKVMSFIWSPAQAQSPQCSGHRSALHQVNQQGAGLEVSRCCDTVVWQQPPRPCVPLYQYLTEVSSTSKHWKGVGPPTPTHYR